MAIVFITIMLLSVSLIGRLTNALLFAKILKAQQTRTLQWIALDYTTGCSMLIILAQLLLALGKYTPQLAFGGLVLLIFTESIFSTVLLYFSLGFNIIGLYILMWIKDRRDKK